MAVNVKVMDITPDVAIEFMRHNIGNRSLSRATVDMYADDLRHNRWHENGQPFTFSGGVMVSGQHRCEAVIKSGVTIKNAVVVYTDDAGMIDTQRTRSVRDLSGIDTLSVAAVNAVLCNIGVAEKKISKSLTILAYSQWKPSVDFVVSMLGGAHQKGLRKAGLVGGCVSAHLVGYSSSLMSDFCEVIKSGFMKTDRDKTAIALRNSAISVDTGGGRKNQVTLYLKTQSALKTYASGRIVSRIHEPKSAIYVPTVDVDLDGGKDDA